MDQPTMNPTNARKNFFKILKEVNNSHREVEVISDREENSAVIIGLSDWRSIQETLYLEQTGTMDIVRKREKEDLGTTNVDDIDWDNL